MRFSVSKNLGHGLRVGASENVGRGGNRRRASAGRPSPEALAAVAAAEQQHALLERQADKVIQNAATIEAQVRDQDGRLRALRASRMQLEVAATEAASDTERQAIMTKIVQHSSTLMDGEQALAQLHELWRTASDAAAKARDAVARNRAHLDSIIARS